MGSIIGKIIASNAVKCFIALVYRTYGIPSWKTPRINTSNIGLGSMVTPDEIKGIHITNVSMFPKKTESDGESFFCFRNNKVRAAKLIPENTAKIFPMIPSSVS